MQNKSCSANDAGYVNLDGRWMCRACGCMNQGCDTCGSCGWNRCGCQGGVVRSANTASRRRSCQDCPEMTMNHTVQECPANTYIRRCFDGCGNVMTANQNGSCGCGCTGTATATVNQTRTCGCNGTATANQTRTCGCGNTAVVNETRTCGCNGTATENQTRTCGNTAVVNETRTCGCNGTAAANANATLCTGLGIVHAVEQELGQVFESESALRTGTLFPDLHKPMNGRCPGSCNCSTTGQQSAFAAWDLRLYLDTHPDDENAKALFRRLCVEAEEPNYATAFLPDDCNGDWTWPDEPWPWECRACNNQ